MTKIKFSSLLFLLALLAHVGYCQKDPLSSLEFSQPIQWHYLSPLGESFFYTGNTLKSISPKTGEVVWESTFSDLLKESFTRLEGSPLYIVKHVNGFKILDAYSGEVKLTSEDLPIKSMRKSHYFPQSNSLLISGKDNEQKGHVILYSLSSGGVLWKGTTETNLVDAHQLEGDDIAFSDFENIYRINSQNGEQIWKSKIVNDKSEGILGFTIIGGKSERISNAKFIKHPSKPLAYFGYEFQKSQPMPGDPNAVSYTMAYYAFNLTDGSHVWTESLTSGGPLVSLLFTDEGFISNVAGTLGNRVNLIKYDEDKTGLWGKNGNGLNVKGLPAGFGSVSTGTLLFTHYRPGSGFLYFIDKNTGQLIDEEIKLEGDLLSVKDYGSYIRVLTSSQIVLLNIANGKYNATAYIPSSPGLVAEGEDKIFVYDTKENAVKTITKETGTLNTLSKKIKLESKEGITHLSLTTEGVIINSSQEVVMIAYDGNIKSRKNFEEPKKYVKESLEEAKLVKLSYEDVADEDVSGFEESLASELSNSRIKFNGAASKVADQYLKTLNERLSQLEKNHLNVYMIDGESNTLLKIDLSTGQAIEKVSLGAEKRPEYMFDAIDGYLYLISESKSVKIFKL